MPVSEEIILNRPSNLTATPGNESVLLKWDPVEGAEGYRIYINDNTTKRYNPIKYTTVPEKVIYSLNNNIEYQFKVRSYLLESGKEVYSDYSDVASCTPFAEGFIAKKPFLILKAAETGQINCTLDGHHVDNVKYVSSDEKVAVVDRTGTVTAISRGEVIIKAFLMDTDQSTEIKVVVDREYPKPVIPITKPRFHKKDGIYTNPDCRSTKSASIILTGDMMCISSQQNKANRDGVYHFSDCFELVRPVISSADFSIGTLETMLSESHSYASEEFKVDGKPNCNSPASFLDGVRHAGFDAVITANNHSCDTELSGIDETLSHIKRYNLINLGIGQRYFVVDVNGIKLAFFAYTMVTNNRDSFLTEQQKDIVLCSYTRKTFEADYEMAKENGAEFFIVMMHWGNMNSGMVRKSQVTAAQELADAGADYIVGSHPHVLQKADTIISASGKEVPVMYSLGNLISSMREMADNSVTMILRLNLEKNQQQVIIHSIQYIPCVNLFSYKGANYVTAPVLPEFCGYDGVNISRIFPQIESIQRFADDRIQMVDIQDKAMRLLAEVAPEAALFNVACSTEGDILKLEWEPVEHAAYYRIYGQSEKDGTFNGMFNSDNSNAEVDIRKKTILALKIKAFRTKNDAAEVIRNSIVIESGIHFESDSYHDASPDFKASGSAIGSIILLNWDHTGDAEGYRIYKKDKKDKNFYGLTNSDTNFKRIADLEMDAYHEFKVKAFKLVNGEKVFFLSSQVVRIFLPYQRPLPAVITGKDNITIQWIPDQIAEGFRIYRENSAGSYTGFIDVYGDKFVTTTNADLKYKVKPFITYESQRIYYNTSNVLSRLPEEQAQRPLISFVIPVYNDEQYLERTFCSILSNTRINCEVIAVNDGSTDNSQVIIDRYCLMFPEIFKSIIQENAGVSRARNAGVAAARGCFIGFIDSDDSIRQETCETYENAINITDADIIISCYYKHAKNKEVLVQGNLPFEELKKLEIDLYLDVLYDKGYAGHASVCNKIYRAELIRNRPMPSIKTEDVAWSPYIASFASSFSYVSSPLYEYMRREGSTSDIISQLPSSEVFERRMKSINFFLENGNPEKEKLLYAIAEKRIQWHIRNTPEKDLYLSALEKIQLKREELQKSDSIQIE